MTADLDFWTFISNFAEGRSLGSLDRLISSLKSTRARPEIDSLMISILSSESLTRPVDPINGRRDPVDLDKGTSNLVA